MRGFIKSKTGKSALFGHLLRENFEDGLAGDGGGGGSSRHHIEVGRGRGVTWDISAHPSALRQKSCYFSSQSKILSGQIRDTVILTRQPYPTHCALETFGDVTHETPITTIFHSH